jgi:hypothetical protein
LSVETGGEVVSVSHEFGVVEEDHAGFERHGLSGDCLSACVVVCCWCWCCPSEAGVCWLRLMNGKETNSEKIGENENFREFN